MTATFVATEEEKAIIQVIRAARTIQEFLWSDMNEESGLEEFRRMFRKRVAKIEAITMDNPHWRVELNKRLLQTAAICVNLMAKSATGRLTHDGIHPTLPSNLPGYASPIAGCDHEWVSGILGPGEFCRKCLAERQ